MKLFTSSDLTCSYVKMYNFVCQPILVKRGADNNIPVYKKKSSKKEIKNFCNFYIKIKENLYFFFLKFIFYIKYKKSLNINSAVLKRRRVRMRGMYSWDTKASLFPWLRIKIHNAKLFSIITSIRRTKIIEFPFLNCSRSSNKEFS